MTEQEILHYGVLGMKWGRRKNSDGSYSKTSSSKRKISDISDEELQSTIKRKSLESAYKKTTSGNSKLDKQKKLVDATNNAIGQTRKALKDNTPKATKKAMDLSNMTDKEMRDRINRTLLEKQYTEMFAEIEQPSVSKGQQRMENLLDAGAATLGIVSGSLAIALAVKDLTR